MCPESGQGGVYDPPERTDCDRCNGMGTIMQVAGPEWCPDCDGSGYEEGWRHAE